MEMQVPTGYFLDDHQIWGDPGAGAIMSRTYAADFPDLSASDDSAFDLLESNCRLMLASLRPGERLQLHYYTSNDFNRPLDRYAAQTAKSKIEICSKVRGDIEARFRKLMNTERLIQANVRISLSAKLPSFVKDGGRKVRAFSDVFKIFARSFKQREQHFKLLMASQGGAIKALNNQEHYEEMLKFWSPGQARLPIFKDLDWMRTVDDLCRFSGLAPRQDPDSGFGVDADALFLAEVFEGVIGIERIDAHFKLLAIARSVGAARRALQELWQFESIHELQHAIASGVDVIEREEPIDGILQLRFADRV